MSVEFFNFLPEEQRKIEIDNNRLKPALMTAASSWDVVFRDFNEIEKSRFFNVYSDDGIVAKSAPTELLTIAFGKLVDKKLWAKFLVIN